MSEIVDPRRAARRALRARLLAERAQFAAGPAAVTAARALEQHLASVLERLEPARLGIYVAMRGEFDPAPLLAASPRWPLALPFCRRTPREMHFRAWQPGTPLPLEDECGIAASDGEAVVPDVVLAPCVGYTESGLRLGYGGGYFDRFLAAHPHVTAVGIAWSASRLTEDELVREPHDHPLMLVVTEQGVV